MDVVADAGLCLDAEAAHQFLTWGPYDGSLSSAELPYIAGCSEGRYLMIGGALLPYVAGFCHPGAFSSARRARRQRVCPAAAHLSLPVPLPLRRFASSGRAGLRAVGGFEDADHAVPGRAVRTGLDHDRVVLALSSSDQIQIGIAAITGLATLIALVNVAITRANERRRGQPIVIAHEADGRRFAPTPSLEMWVVDAYLTSEGGGPAFNVRFGVEFAGVRYAYRFSADDPEDGNVQRILRAGDRRPESGAWRILIDSLSMMGRAADDRGDLDANRVYWARYENAQRQTWETRNPGDRSAKLDIRRVRWTARRERREQRCRRDAVQHDEAWLRAALAELQDQTGADVEE